MVRNCEFVLTWLKKNSILGEYPLTTALFDIILRL